MKDSLGFVVANLGEGNLGRRNRSITVKETLVRSRSMLREGDHGSECRKIAVKIAFGPHALNPRESSLVETTLIHLSQLEKKTHGHCP